MFSPRGALSTSYAMMECAASQEGSRGSGIFLLSELEGVWASMSILISRWLLEGKNVQVPNFGSFWLESQHLASDDIYGRRYCTRKVCFGFHPHLATRYSLTERVPLQKQGIAYTKVLPAHIVAICKIPAYRTTLALREFFLYLGEGLFKGLVFDLRFPGVGSVLIRKDQMQLTTDWELQSALFDVDAKRWSPEMKVHCRQALQELVLRGPASRPSTASASRPTSSCSWERPPSAGMPMDRAVFTPAAPAGRLFSDIAKDNDRRREAHRKAVESEKSLAQRLQDMDDHAVRHVECSPSFQHQSEWRPQTMDSCASGESIYNALDVPPPWIARTQPNVTVTQPRREVYRLPSDDDGEDDVEVVEVTVADERSVPPLSGGLERRQVAASNGAPSSTITPRPASRSYHDHSSVRDLIYSSQADGAQDAVRYGRKRFDVGQPADGQ